MPFIIFHRTAHTDQTFCDYTLSWNTTYNADKCQPMTAHGYTYGGNFVDVNLKVVVLNDTGTALVRYST